jgi:hypothetical protein
MPSLPSKFYHQRYLIFFIILIISSCALKPPASQEMKPPPLSSKNFSNEEMILAQELLSKIFDQEMAPLECIPNTDEAGLLLRTLRPRMEVVEDDLEASLDDNNKVKLLIESCHNHCICSYVEDLLKEHQVVLGTLEKKSLMKKNSPKELSRCLNFAKSTFCQSELYKELSKEKVDFTFEEMP